MSKDFFAGDKLILFSSIDGFARTGETIFVQGYGKERFEKVIHYASYPAYIKTYITDVVIVGIEKNNKSYTMTIHENILKEKTCEHNFIKSTVEYKTGIFIKKIKTITYNVCKKCGYREENGT